MNLARALVAFGWALTLAFVLVVCGWPLVLVILRS